MKLSMVLPLLMVPALALASVGCASNDEEVASDEGAATAAAGVEFTSAVGALVVDGKKLCTAALVDVDAGARIGPVSAHGRQIVFGGACVGQLQNNVSGAAVFVTQQNNVSVSSPIIAFDFKSQASAGLAVGILSEPVAGAQPLDVVGLSAITNAGVHTATVLEANENGVLIGTATEFHAGADIALNTQCTSLQFGVKVGVAAGAAVSLRDDGLGAAAFVRINGQLHFAAHIDGQCIARHFGEAVARLDADALKTADQIATALNSIGTGDVIAVTHTKTNQTQLKIRMTEDALAIRVNSKGAINAQTWDESGAMTAACTKLPFLGLIGGPCELRPLGGEFFHKNELVKITIKVGSLVPDGPLGQQVTISTTNEAGPSGGPDPSTMGGG
jgi:hypothetical protein